MVFVTTCSSIQVHSLVYHALWNHCLRSWHNPSNERYGHTFLEHLVRRILLQRVRAWRLKAHEEYEIWRQSVYSSHALRLRYCWKMPCRPDTLQLTLLPLL